MTQDLKEGLLAENFTEIVTSILSGYSTASAAESSFPAKKSPSFLTNGNFSSTGSHIRPNEFKNKQMAVSETGIDLLFHCDFRFFKCLHFQ